MIAGPAVPLAHGVVRSDGPVWIVRVAEDDCPALPAASCLVRPEPGDKVLVALAGGAGHILAVLERADAASPITITAADGIALDAGRGDLGLKAAGRLDLAAAGLLTVATVDLAVRAGTAGLSADDATADIGQTTIRAGALKLIAGRVEHIVDRLAGRLGHALRFVTGVDRLQAGSIEREAEDALNLDGRRAIVSARGDVHVDGGRIHIA